MSGPTHPVSQARHELRGDVVFLILLRPGHQVQPVSRLLRIGDRIAPSLFGYQAEQENERPLECQLRLLKLALKLLQAFLWAH